VNDEPDDSDVLAAAAGRDAERRRTTVLFADITGFTSLVEQAGDEDAYAIIGAALRLLDAIVVKHGGCVEKHAGDCVVAVFGAPIALENAPRAALRAALEMRRAIREFSRRRGLARPLEVHSGLETGTVMADPQREAADLVLGDFVNLAAKLKDAAPAGEIWAGGETFRATAADFEYRGLEPLSVDRKPAVPIYALLTTDEASARDRAGSALSSPLVGRDRELATLREQLAAVARGESRVACIRAETGVGKSRLIAELQSAPEAVAVRWLEARSVATDPAHPSHAFHPFADLLRSWAGIGTDDTAEPLAKLEAALERLLGSDADDVVPFVASLLNVPLRAEARRRLEAAGAARSQQLGRALARVVNAIAAERPVALVFDDLQVADAASIDLLCDLLRPGSVSPALFVLAASREHLANAERVFAFVRAEWPTAQQLDVTPLGAEASDALFGHLTGGSDVSVAVRREILAKAAGNPLFVEEALRLLQDEGAGELHDARIPDTLDAILEARIARLPSERRRVVEAAAATGARFWLPVLSVMLERNDLGEVLPALEDAGLVVAGDEQEWSFRHPRIREVTLAQTPEPRRRDLARRVAEAMGLCETGRRRATALFADVEGFTSLGGADSGDLLGACLRLLDAIVVKHGGHVEKHAGDCVVAVFGAPVAIENAPRAAVNAALEMRRAVRDYGRARGLAQPLDVHCGVNTGSVIADPRKSAGTSDLPVFGDVVNIASRLKDKAPAGEIWVGRETWRATRGEFDYRAFPPLALKGKRDAVAVYGLLSEEERVHRPRAGSGGISSPLVGRESEFALLRARVAALARGESSVVTVIADAGLGKSRLLAELAATPEARAALWLEGRALSIGANLHHHPFVDLFRSWAGIGNDDGDAALAKLDERLDALFGDDAAELQPFLATLMNLRRRPDAQRRFEAMQGDAREKLLQRAAARVLSRLAAQRPLVLVFDDLHWADGSSVELLCELLRSNEVAPASFLLLARPHHPETSGRVLEFARENCDGRYDEIELAPLDVRDVTQLIENLFAGGDVPPATRAAILAKVAGNPFFAEEVVRSLVDDGAVEVRDGTLHATARIHSAVIPGTVEETILGRIDRLAPERRRVLEVAAVIGGTFWAPVLKEVFDKDGLDRALEGLVDAGLIAPAPGSAGGQEWRFKHPLLQEVAYGTMLRARRVELHRKVAEAIELWLTDRVPGYHAMLAWHYGQGRDLERAEEYLFRAGREAVQAAASNEALHFFRQAAALYLQLHPEGGDPRKLAELEKSVGIALMNRGSLVEAIDHFNAALVHLGDPVSPSRLGRTVRFGADVGAVVFDTYKPWSRRHPAAGDAQREQIDIRFRRGLSQSATSPEFVFDTMATLRRAMRVDPSTIPHAAAIYAGALAIFSYGGVSLSIGRRLLDRTLEIGDDASARELTLYCRLMRWIHHYLAGDWSAQHDIEQGVLDEGLRFGRLWEFQTYLDLECERRIFRGDFAGARERLGALTDFAERYRHDHALAASQALGAYLHLERRELPEALAAIEQYYRDHGEPSFQIQALGTAAKIRCLAGDLPGAEAAIERAGALMARAGRQPPFHESRYASARLLVDVARIDAAGGARGLVRSARRDCRHALRLAGKVAARRPEVWRLAGTLAWQRGRKRAAARWWEKSAAEAQRLGMHPERERTAAEVALRTGGS
jgi:predicted ATPase